MRNRRCIRGDGSKKEMARPISEGRFLSCAGKVETCQRPGCPFHILCLSHARPVCAKCPPKSCLEAAVSFPGLSIHRAGDSEAARTSDAAPFASFDGRQSPGIAVRPTRVFIPALTLWHHGSIWTSIPHTPSVIDFIGGINPRARQTLNGEDTARSGIAG